jgi:diacylglycerol kinase (ATP)
VLRVALLVNPAAAGGRGRHRIAALARTLGRSGASVEIHETRGPGDAPRIVDACRRAAVDLIAVAGGDGTLNEVSQAYLDRDGVPVPGPPIAALPLGTGTDFHRTLGVGRDLDAAIERLLQCEPRPHDLGSLRLTAPDGARRHRAFLNITSFGVAAHVVPWVIRTPAFLGPTVRFHLATMRALASYRNKPVRVCVDGQPWLESPIVNVMIANGRYFAGGMKIAPAADAADGVFDVVAIGDRSKLGTVALTAHVYAGTHVGRRHITSTRGTVVHAEASRAGDVVLVDMDGETPGRLPLEARVVPGAIWIRA